jgi:hypothetical protein
VKLKGKEQEAKRSKNQSKIIIHRAITPSSSVRWHLRWRRQIFFLKHASTASMRTVGFAHHVNYHPHCVCENAWWCNIIILIYQWHHLIMIPYTPFKSPKKTEYCSRMSRFVESSYDEIIRKSKHLGRHREIKYQINHLSFHRNRTKLQLYNCTTSIRTVAASRYQTYIQIG